GRLQFCDRDAPAPAAGTGLGVDFPGPTGMVGPAQPAVFVGGNHARGAGHAPSVVIVARGSTAAPGDPRPVADAPGWPPGNSVSAWRRTGCNVTGGTWSVPTRAEGGSLVQDVKPPVHAILARYGRRVRPCGGLRP